MFNSQANNIYSDSTNLYFSSNRHRFNVGVANPDILTINSTGLGIRTTTPAYSLDVSGAIQIQNTNRLYLNNPTNNVYGDVSNIYYNISGGTHQFNVTNTNIQTINNIGVGIGTTTPSSSLHVIGSTKIIPTADTCALFVGDSGNLDPSVNYGTVSITRPYNSYNRPHIGFVRYGQNTVQMGYLQNSNNFGLFQNGLYGSGLGTPSICLDGSNTNYVGINNNAPSYNLDVTGSGRFITNSSLNPTTPNLILDNLYNTGWSSGQTSISTIQLTGLGVGGTIQGFNVYGLGGGLIFNTTYPSITERMRINYNGNIGIGTTSPSYALDIVGTTRIQSTNPLYLNNPTNNVYGDVSNIYYNVSGGTHQFNVTNTKIQTINNTGIGIKTTTPGYSLDVSGVINTNSAYSYSYSAAPTLISQNIGYVFSATIGTNVTIASTNLATPTTIMSIGSIPIGTYIITYSVYCTYTVAAAPPGSYTNTQMALSLNSTTTNRIGSVNVHTHDVNNTSNTTNHTFIYSMPANSTLYLVASTSTANNVVCPSTQGSFLQLTRIA